LILADPANDVSEWTAVDPQPEQRPDGETRAHNAELARGRLAFLLSLSASLSESLDYEETLRRLGRRTVESIADLCLIDVRNEDGSIVRVVAVHRDPALQPLADELHDRYAPSEAGPHPAAHVLTTGGSLMRHEMSDDYLRQTTRDERHFEIVKALGFESFMSVPLVARESILGSLTLVSSDPERRYGDEDLLMAQEVARRAAISIDNARLYTASTRTASQLEHLQSITDLAIGAARVDELLEGLLLRIIGALGTDQAVVLLLDEHEPALRARAAVGFELGVLDQVVVPVGRGFAGRLAASREPRVLSDPSEIAGISIPLGARAAVGVPLLLGDELVGVLHTSSDADRAFGPDEIKLLQLAAERMALAIRRTQYHEHEHEIAHLLQQSLLPASLPTIPGIELAVRFRAAGLGTEVGGDFYDAFPVGDDRWALAIGDVCGRGPIAAAVTGLVRNGLRALSVADPAPGAVLTGVNEAMLRSDADRFCTAVYATIDPVAEGARVTLGRAGHPAPLIVRSNGAVEPCAPRGTLLGVFPDISCEEAKVELDPGDAIVLFTDGLTERGIWKGDPAELETILASTGTRSAEDVAAILESMLGTGPVHDDVAIMVARALDPVTA
jgi:sigma-B regulation protein RsbU (phosphoserine phosphatase)